MQVVCANNMKRVFTRDPRPCCVCLTSGGGDQAVKANHTGSLESSGEGSIPCCPVARPFLGLWPRHSNKNPDQGLSEPPWLAAHHAYCHTLLLGGLNTGNNSAGSLRLVSPRFCPKHLLLCRFSSVFFHCDKLYHSITGSNEPF